MSRFSTVPTIHAPRSAHDLSYGNKTTMNVGTLYPIYIQEIYPGDTFDNTTSFVARVSSSFLRPVMDNLFIDIMYFFVPYRLVFDKFPAIFGENDESAWAQEEETTVPCFGDDLIVSGTGVYGNKTVSDYLGVPPGCIVEGLPVLPFRAFAKIYNDWFRDENLIDPMFIEKGEWRVGSYEKPNNQPWSPYNYCGQLPKVAKFHDIFTSSLPNTQKFSSPVQVPIGSYAPITTGSDMNYFPTPLQLSTQYGGNMNNLLLGLNVTGTSTGNGQVRMYDGTNIAGSGIEGTNKTVMGSNLYADLASAGLLNVTDLRYAFQLQRILERSARAGTRYPEYLLSAFGVSSPDARLQRSEYLGGKRLPISVQQVAQTNRGNSEETELGSLGAFSLTNGKCGYQKGFVEHGVVIACACLRQYHSYPQGLEKFWQRKRRFDFYDPILANISEVPVYKSELYALGEMDIQGSIFGYQEAWYDLRSRQSICTGDMRSDSPTSLDIWHFADDYSNAPTLNQQFIEETPKYVDRTLAVPSTSQDQFIVDFYFKQRAIRRIPAYSIPGLIDHH